MYKLSFLNVPQSFNTGWWQLGINLISEPKAQLKKRLALGTIRAVLMCLRRRIQIRAALLGVITGLGVTGFLVMWTKEGVYTKQKSVMRYKAGEGMLSHLLNT